MSGSPNPGQQPGADPAADPVHRPGLRRYVRAFTDGAGRPWSPRRLTARPVLLVVALAAALAIPVAIGAIPVLLRSKPATGAVPTLPAVPTTIITTMPALPQPAAASPAAAPGGPVPTAVLSPDAGQGPTTPADFGTPRAARINAGREAAARPSPTPSPTPSPAASPGTRATYAAVAGFGCRPNATTTFAEHGRYSAGLSGFIKVPAGGLRADGCNGSFDAMPMSGSATADDRANYAVWTFHTGAVTRGLCHIDVYIPDDSSIEHVGGNPAFYQVFGSARATGTPMGSFEIDQTYNLGRWASRHNWQITGGVLTVKLHSRGIDWSGNTVTHAHIAVSPVLVTCET